MREQELPEQLPRFERLLAVGRANLAPDHPALLDFRQQFALALAVAGIWRQGADERASVIADQEAAGSEQIFDFGTTKTFLGEMLWVLGEYEAAISLQRQALVNLMADADAAPIEAAAAHYHLAHALFELERFAEAETEFARARQIVDDWAIPDGSVLHLSLQNALGRMRLRQGRADEAIVLLESAIAGFERNEWGMKNDSTGFHRLWRALAYQSGGRLDEAEATARDALRRERALHGQGHSFTQMGYLTLAEILLEVGRDEEAREQLHAVDRDALAQLGSAHPLQGRRLRLIGLLASAAGAREQARADLQAAMKIFETCYGSEHSFTQRARAELANAA
jgi:tetratricopeptide (TPR) repeat protein